MTIEKMKYFVAVADSMNITQAAKALFITQQSLSSHIRSIEEELNVRLFVRKPRLALTPAGIYFSQYARQAILLNESLMNDLRHLEGKRDTITICVGPVRSQHLLPVVLPVFSEKYPYVETRIITGQDEELNAVMRQENADVYIGSASTMEPSLTKLVLREEAFHLIVSESLMQKLFPGNYHEKMAEFENAVDISGFSNAKFLLPTANTYRALLDNYLKRNSIVPKSVTESNDNETLTRLSLKGMGVSFSIEPHAYILSHESRTTQKEKVCAFPIPDLTYQVVISFPSNKRLSAAAKAFISVLQEFYPH